MLLDFPEGLLRKDLYSMDDLGFLFGEDEVDWDVERSLMENIKKAIPVSPETDYYFPLGLSEHVDHLLVRNIGVELIREGKVKKGYFYEDIWPFLPNIEREVVSKDIRDVPSYITK